MDEMPNCPNVKGCHCFPEEELDANTQGCTHCVCGESEKALRIWARGSLLPMTKEQREWCYQEIDAVEAHDREDYVTASDGELARGVLDAWREYCQDKGLL